MVVGERSKLVPVPSPYYEANDECLQWGRSKKITVNSVAPGPVTTDSNPYEEFQKPSIDITRAADRAGTPEDIADAVLLLVSEKARWITGQYISVSGGVTN
jgi:NAD(P)-dependent dehydrogenase (short-subunit alcohol dehydrogenase family)